MNRIAVIGATGMIGHHTARAVVDAGHDLVVIHRPGSKLEQISDLQFEPVVADLNDAPSLTRALQSADAVINCAGYYPTVPRAWRAELATAEQQMRNFYGACAASQLQKIVYLGGAIALRRHPEGLPGNETLEYPGQPASHNPYLQVKWAMDSMAREQAAAGLPVVTGIPSMTFGEYDYGPTTGQLIVEIANGTLPAYVRGLRNTIYAGDAGRGLLACCIQGRPGERYLLTGENVSMDELARRIAALAGVPAPRAAPLAVARLIGGIQLLRYRWFGGPVPKISATAIAVMSAGQYLDGSKARRELGFEARVSLDEALQRAMVWFRDVGYIR